MAKLGQHCWFGLICLLAGSAVAGPSALAADILCREDAAACIQWAAGELGSAIAAAHPASAGETVVVDSLDEPAVDGSRDHWAGLVPAEAESFAIRHDGRRLIIAGRDRTGTMYGLFEVAEQLRGGLTLDSVKASTQHPFLAIRGVNQFVHEDALQDPHSWFFQDAFWEGYFSLLARSRHNLLDLHGGYNLVETNFPNLYPYFISLDEFPGQSMGRETAARNLAMLNRIIAIGDRHGVKVGLMNYTVQGRKNEEKSRIFDGFDAARLSRYTYLASRALLRGCPGLWMFGFRIGESGQAEDFFQKTYLAAVGDSGFKGKLYTRSWLATRHNIEVIKHGFPGDFFVEVKYNGEQLGLPYQAITSPTRFDPSYSYEAYTSYPRGYRLIYQVRANGTTRIFHWGDPEFVARVVRSCRLGEAAGYSVEPMTAYYPMVDRYHPADGLRYFQWTWQRDWFWYEVWGRLGYDPGLDPAVFRAMFQRRFGGEGDALYATETAASQVVPIVDTALTLGPDQRQWAPEFETGNPDFGSLDGLREFGNLGEALDVSPLDPTVMASVADAARAEMESRRDGRLSPRDSAARLFAAADRIDADLGFASMVSSGRGQSAAAQEAAAIRLDALALASLARFAGERYLAGIALAEYRASSYPPALASAEHHLRWAREHWRRLAAAADRQYAPVLETERMRSQAFAWGSQLPVLDGDLAYLRGLEDAWNSHAKGEPAHVLAHLPGTEDQMPSGPVQDAAWPIQWRASAYVDMEQGGRPALCAPTGCLGFAVDPLSAGGTGGEAALTVNYWDPGDGGSKSIGVSYDDQDSSAGALATAGTIALNGSRGWRQATFMLRRPRLAGGGPGNAAIVLAANDGGSFIVQSPALQWTTLPTPHLDLFLNQAFRRPPSAAAVHWRTPGGDWQTHELTRGSGESGIETEARSREVYRFDLPEGLTGAEYYFTANWKTDHERLPQGTGSFSWRPPVPKAGPVIDPAPPAPASARREGSIELRTRVSDPAGVARVVLYFKAIPSQLRWQQVEMKPKGGDEFVAAVPLTADGMLYRFGAWSRSGAASLFPDFRREPPYRLIPAWDASGPSASSQ